FRIAYGSMTPLHPGHMRLRKATAVSGAHTHRGYFNDIELGRQIFIVQFKRFFYRLAGDAQLPFRSLDLWNAGEMIANEKRVVRRENVVEVVDGGFEIGRAE